MKVNDCQKMPFVISVHDANIFQHVGGKLFFSLLRIDF